MISAAAPPRRSGEGPALPDENLVFLKSSPPKEPASSHGGREAEGGRQFPGNYLGEE